MNGLSTERCDLLAQQAPDRKAMNCDKFYEIAKDTQFSFCGLGTPSLRSFFKPVMLEVLKNLWVRTRLLYFGGTLNH